MKFIVEHCPIWAMEILIPEFKGHTGKHIGNREILCETDTTYPKRSLEEFPHLCLDKTKTHLHLYCGSEQWKSQCCFRKDFHLINSEHLSRMISKILGPEIVFNGLYEVFNIDNCLELLQKLKQ